MICIKIMHMGLKWNSWLSAQGYILSTYYCSIFSQRLGGGYLRYKPKGVMVVQFDFFIRHILLQYDMPKHTDSFHSKKERSSLSRIWIGRCQSMEYGGA